MPGLGCMPQADLKSTARQTANTNQPEKSMGGRMVLGQKPQHVLTAWDTRILGRIHLDTAKGANLTSVVLSQLLNPSLWALNIQTQNNSMIQFMLNVLHKYGNSLFSLKVPS